MSVSSLGSPPSLGLLVSVGQQEEQKAPHGQLSEPGPTPDSSSVLPGQSMCFSPGWLGASSPLSSLSLATSDWLLGLFHKSVFLPYWIGTLFQMTPEFARLSENCVMSSWASLSVWALAGWLVSLLGLCPSLAASSAGPTQSTRVPGWPPWEGAWDATAWAACPGEGSTAGQQQSAARWFPPISFSKRPCVKTVCPRGRKPRAEWASPLGLFCREGAAGAREVSPFAVLFWHLQRTGRSVGWDGLPACTGWTRT